jgi:uncharacterized membrane protein YcfT
MQAMSGIQTHDGRVDWVDYAKGFCIVFVVMMHSTLGVGAATGQTGWLHPVVAFALPFRMPDFFMISGLFLAVVIERDWRTYLDRKVVHFAYFYLLWMTIQFVFKAPSLAQEHGSAEVVRLYFVSLIDPFGTLWFIYLLPIFFVVIKLTRRVPIWVMWPLAAALEIWHPVTGWMVPDEFAARFVYIYTGYVLASHIFNVAKRAQDNPWNGIVMLALWAPVNGTFVALGWEKLPFISLALGLLGAAAVIRAGALLSLTEFAKPLRYCGRNSIVIYLAFFLPMAASRAVLLRTGIITDIGAICAIVTACGVFGSLAMLWAANTLGARFLFERPARFWLTAKPRPRIVLQPAE